MAASTAFAATFTMAGIFVPIDTDVMQIGPSIPRVLRPSWRDMKAGIMKAGLAQLPLTTLNSVIAVSQLASALFPDR